MHRLPTTMLCSYDKAPRRPYDLLANDVDIDGTLVRQSLVITSSPKSGTIRFNTDGTIVFTPDPNFLGVDTFRYTVRDNSGATSNQATVTVTVSGELPADWRTTIRRKRTEDSPCSIDLVGNDTDLDGSVVPGSITVTTQPSTDSVVVNLDGTAVYQPVSGYVGMDEFRYTVRDDFNEVSNIGDGDGDDLRTRTAVAESGESAGRQQRRLCGTHRRVAGDQRDQSARLTPASIRRRHRASRCSRRRTWT